MGGVASTHNAQPQTTVPTGKIRICVAGFYYSPFTGRAHKLANEIAAAYPDTFETWFYWDHNGAYYKYLLDTFDKVPFPTKIKGHSSSPFVWLEVAKSEAKGASAEAVNAMDGDNAVLQILGGCTQFQHWAQRRVAKADGSTLLAKQSHEEGASVARGPDTVFFKESDKGIVEAATTMSFLWDTNHFYKFGPQTAAEAAAPPAK